MAQIESISLKILVCMENDCFNIWWKLYVPIYKYLILNYNKIFNIVNLKFVNLPRYLWKFNIVGIHFNSNAHKKFLLLSDKHFFFLMVVEKCVGNLLLKFSIKRKPILWYLTETQFEKFWNFVNILTSNNKTYKEPCIKLPISFTKMYLLWKILKKFTKFEKFSQGYPIIKLA